MKAARLAVHESGYEYAHGKKPGASILVAYLGRVPNLSVAAIPTRHVVKRD